LVAAGYLDYEPVGGKYQLRPRILTLGFSLLSNMRVLPVAYEQLQRLATASGCTISLAWPDAPKMIYLDRCLGEVVPYYFSVGSAIDMVRTATGPSLSCFALMAATSSAVVTISCAYVDASIYTAACIDIVSEAWQRGASQAAEKRSERRVVADRSMPMTYR
jgi:hypothetical protein